MWRRYTALWDDFDCNDDKAKVQALCECRVLNGPTDNCKESGDVNAYYF